MKTISYKGFQASVEFDDGSLFVKVLHIDDLLVAECDSASEAPKALEELVDGYLDDCKRLGREPTKPFSGSFNIRVDSEVHRKAAVAAAEHGVSLNAWVGEAIAEKIACGDLSSRMDNLVVARAEEAATSRSVRTEIRQILWQERSDNGLNDERISEMMASISSVQKEWTN